MRAQLPQLARALTSWPAGAYPAARQAPAADGLHDASLALLLPTKPAAQRRGRLSGGDARCWPGVKAVCVGVPMQVLRLESLFAVWCRDASGGEALIDIGLIARRSRATGC